jgi:hypothetical protein
MKRRQRFELVFEDHIPETAALLGLPVQTAALVQRRDDPAAKILYRVIRKTRQGQATVEPTYGGETADAMGEALIAQIYICGRFSS